MNHNKTTQVPKRSFTSVQMVHTHTHIHKAIGIIVLHYVCNYTVYVCVCVRAHVPMSQCHTNTVPLFHEILQTRTQWVAMFTCAHTHTTKAHRNYLESMVHLLVLKQTTLCYHNVKKPTHESHSITCPNGVIVIYTKLGPGHSVHLRWSPLHLRQFSTFSLISLACFNLR